MPESKIKKDDAAAVQEATADSAVQQSLPAGADPVLPAGADPVLPAAGGDSVLAAPPAVGDAVAGSFGPDAIQVVAKCDTFRRAGFVFTRNATTLPLAELSQQQLVQLSQEPMLAVQAVRLDTEG
jgi:hypothetical protein